jgi:TRAP-type C4-dicarboxylate transport system substrate-binding protein
MKIKLSVAPIAAVIVAASVAAVPASADTYRLKIASGHNMNWHFIQIAHDYFVPELKKRVAERTPHKVEILEGWASSILKATEVLEGTQSGIVDLGYFCYCHEGGKLALHNFPYYAPFASPSPEVANKATRRVYDQIPALHEILEKDNNQRHLAIMPIDNYDIIAKFEFTRVDQAKGRKFGGAGPNLPWVERMGGIPVSVTGPEFYTAFQTGLFEGAIAFVSIMDSLKLYPIAPYYVRVNLGSMSIFGLDVNLNSFNKLPKDVQDILVETARDMEIKGGPFTQEVTDKYMAIIEKNGAKIINFPEEERTKWAELLKDWPNERAGEIEKETGAPMKATLKAMITAVEEEGYTWPIRYKID